MGSLQKQKSPSFQQLYGTPKSSHYVTSGRSTPVRRCASPRAGSKGRGSKQNMGSVSRTGCILDAVALFDISAAVRQVMVVNDRVAWTADTDGSIRVRNSMTGNELRTLEGRCGAFCTCLIFNGAVGDMWAAFSDGFFRIYNVETYAIKGEFMQHNGAVECMVILEDAVYTGGRDWKIYKWKPDKTNYERQYSGHTNAVRCLCPYSAPTGALLFSGSDDGTVKAWDPSAPLQPGKGSTACMHSFVGHTLGVLALELVEVSNQLWSAGEDATIRVWSLQTLDCISVLHSHSAPISCLTLVEQRMWSGDKHGRIFMWDIRTLVPVQEISSFMPVKHKSVLDICRMVSTVVWKVWTAGSDGQVQCWNVESTPVLLEGDMSGLQLHHLQDGDLREALESENKLLRNELASLKKRLQSGRKAARPNVLYAGKAEEALLNVNVTPSSQLLNEEQSDGSITECVKTSRTPESQPCTEFPKRGSLRETITSMPRGGESKDASLASHSAHQFSGGVWGDDVSSKIEELRTVFHREVVKVLLSFTQQWSDLRTLLGSNRDDAVAQINITHKLATPRSGMQAQPLILEREVHDRTITEMHLGFMDKKELVEKRRAVFQEMQRRRGDEKKKMDDIILKQQREISELREKLHGIEVEKKVLQDDLRRSGETPMRRELSRRCSDPRTLDKSSPSRPLDLNNERDIELVAKDERINHLNEKLKTLQDDCKRLQNEVYRLRQHVQDLRRENKVLYEGLSDAGDAQVKIVKLRWELENLRGDHSGCSGSATPRGHLTAESQNGRIDRLQERVRTLQVQQKTLNALLEAEATAFSGSERQVPQLKNGMKFRTGDDGSLTEGNSAFSHTLARLEAAVVLLNSSFGNAMQRLIELQEDRERMYQNLQAVGTEAPQKSHPRSLTE